MKFTMKKFQLVRKYANYPTWDEKQNAPFKKFSLLNANLKKNVNLTYSEFRKQYLTIKQNSV